MRGRRPLQRHGAQTRQRARTGARPRRSPRSVPRSRAGWAILTTLALGVGIISALVGVLLTVAVASLGGPVAGAVCAAPLLLIWVAVVVSLRDPSKGAAIVPLAIVIALVVTLLLALGLISFLADGLRSGGWDSSVVLGLGMVFLAVAGPLVARAVGRARGPRPTPSPSGQGPPAASPTGPVIASTPTPPPSSTRPVPPVAALTTAPPGQGRISLGGSSWTTAPASPQPPGARPHLPDPGAERPATPPPAGPGPGDVWAQVLASAARPNHRLWWVESALDAGRESDVVLVDPQSGERRSMSLETRLTRHIWVVVTPARNVVAWAPESARLAWQATGRP